MNTPIALLPPDVRTIQEDLDTVRYLLPRRNLGRARLAGVPFLVMGVFVTGFMLFWMGGPISNGLQMASPARWFLIGFGLLGLPGLATGLGVFGLGIALVFNLGHSEIVLGRGTIESVERFGFLRLRRRRTLAGIARFVVQQGLLAPGPIPGRTSPLFPGGEVGMILAEQEEGKPLWIAPAYPLALLRLFAQALATAAGKALDAGSLEVSGEPLPVAERAAGDEDAVADETVERPAGTPITCDERPDGVAILVPAAGLWKGSHGLFFFAIMWNGILSAIVTVVFLASGKGDRPPWFVYLFLSAFMGIGIAVLLGAINMGRRRVIIAVVKGLFAYRTMGPFGVKEKKVACDQIASVGVRPSGMEVNDQPVMELQVHVKGGGKNVGLLASRTREEQEWLAAVLRRVLRVPRP